MIGTKTVLWLLGILLLMVADGRIAAQTAGTCALGAEYCEGVNTTTTTTSTSTATNTNVNTNNNTNVNTTTATNTNNNNVSGCWVWEAT